MDEAYLQKIIKTLKAKLVDVSWRVYQESGGSFAKKPVKTKGNQPYGNDQWQRINQCITNFLDEWKRTKIFHK